VSTYERLARLPLEIDGYDLEPLELEVSPEFTRLTTVIRLPGGGEEGAGEDVTYDALDQIALQDAGPSLPLAGTHTVDSFSQLLEGLDLWPSPPVREPSRLYRRWAYESAGLDLALRQAGTSLAALLGREPRPVSFVVSMRIPDPPSLEPITRRLEHYPDLRFKLDPQPSWDHAFIDSLRETGAVDSVDLKGHYRDTPVDVAPSAEFYERVVTGFPDAWIEDPALTPETDRVLEPHRDRITWDAPIHSVADIEALPFPPKMVNVKPSRFGSLHKLCAAYDYCEERGIRAYGGGQYELGPGRGHIQYLASLFHPDTPNDVAPGGFHSPKPPPGLPTSPLPPQTRATGFVWGE
jgi:L-alanine-DL-glutamate epimerase-like enolase superfamily enzyme